MSTRRILELGGIAAGAILIVFGVVAIALGVSARNTVRDSLADEQIFFASAEDPAVAKHAKQWAGDQVRTGEQARAFALIMHDHASEASGGLTYAQMGRYALASDPADVKGTNDETAALKGDDGSLVPNGARNVWVTETALATALNVSYMAENLALFALVVGVALLLTGVGLVILALRVLGAGAEAPARDPSIAPRPAVG